MDSEFSTHSFWHHSFWVQDETGHHGVEAAYVEATPLVVDRKQEKEVTTD